MQNLVVCGTVPQYKPKLKMSSNYLFQTKKYQSNCSAVLNVVPNAEIDEKFSKAGLQKKLIPEHVAIIFDGSRRWHKAQGKPLTYEPLFQANTLFADLCLKYGVATATTFLYSIKNMQRGKEANDLLFGQLEKFLENNVEDFIRKAIRVSMIGERTLLPKSLHNIIKQVEDVTRTKHTSQLHLMLAVCYSGTRDIVEATKNICEKVKAGVIEPHSVDEALMDQELWTRGTPHPDLLIRTGSRLRVSDYLIWQLAQSEFYFTELCAPEFGEDGFLQALRSFQQRERLFGK